MSYFGKYSGRFTLVDIEGVVLDNPLDELSINEPEDFGNVKFKMERSRKWRAFNSEASDAESLNLKFDRVVLGEETYSAFTFLKAVREAAGVDADIRLRAYRTPNGGSEEYKEWGLVFSSYDEEDYAISFRVKRIDFNDKLRTRFNQSINLGSSTNLDDVADTPLSLIDLPLHSQIIEQLDRHNMGGITQAEISLQPITLNDDNDFWIMLGMPNTDLDESGGWTGISGNVTDVEPYLDMETSTFKVLSREINYSIQASYVFLLDMFYDVLVPGFGDYDWELKYSLNKTSPVTLASGSAFSDNYFSQSLLDSSIDDEGYAVATRIRIDLESECSGNDQPITFSLSGDVNTELKIDVYLEVRAETGNVALPVAYKLTYLQDFEDLSPCLNFNNFFNSDLYTQNSPSICQGAFIGDVLNKQIQKAIGDESYSPLRSDVVGDGGCGEFNFVTTGNKIRGINTRSIITPIETITNFLRVRYNIGMSIVNTGSTTYVDLHRYNAFFQDVQILELESINDGARRKINDELIISDLKVGYDRYSNPNKGGGRGGFNTERSYLFPLDRNKKESEIIAKVYTDGLEIERIKRLDVNQKESDQSDEDVFIIKCQKFDSNNKYYTYTGLATDKPELEMIGNTSDNTITFYGLIILGMAATDKIVVTGGAGAATYIVTDVEVDLLNNRTVFTVASSYSGNFGLVQFYFTDTTDVDKPFYQPERLEPYVRATVGGLVDATWEYNIDHAPSNILLEWFDYYGGALKAKADSKKIKVGSIKNNVDLVKEYAGLTCALTTDLITESQEFTLEDLRDYNPGIFTDMEYTIEVTLDYDTQFKDLQAALFGEHGTLDYGYITFPFDGESINAYPVDLDYSTDGLICKIICWEKA